VRRKFNDKLFEQCVVCCTHIFLECACVRFLRLGNSCNRQSAAVTVGQRGVIKEYLEGVEIAYLCHEEKSFVIHIATDEQLRDG